MLFSKQFYLKITLSKILYCDIKTKVMEDKKLTAANGRPVADNQNVQTVGPRARWYYKTLGSLRS